MNVQNAVVLTFGSSHGLAANQFYRFDIALQYYSSYQVYYNTIFEGLAYADSNANATIRIDEVLRAYAWKWEKSYINENNGAAYILPALAAASTHEQEFGRDVFNRGFARVRILSEDGQAVVTQRNIYIETGSQEPWRRGTAAKSHIPNVATEHYFAAFMLDAIQYPAEGKEPTVYISNKEATYGGYDGYIPSGWKIHSNNAAACVPLNILLPTFDAEDGDELALFEAQADENRQDMKLYGLDTVIDGCPAPFYVAWTARDGRLISTPFHGRMYAGLKPEAASYTDIYAAERVHTLTDRLTFALYTEPLTATEHNRLCGIVESPDVYLYDTTADRLFNCVVDGRSLTARAYGDRKLQPFSITLKESLTLTR